MRENNNEEYYLEILQKDLIFQTRVCFILGCKILINPM